MRCKPVSTTSLQHEWKTVLKFVCSVPTVLCEVFWFSDCLLLWCSAVNSVYDWIEYVIICYLISVEICKYSVKFCTDKCKNTWDRCIEERVHIISYVTKIYIHGSNMHVRNTCFEKLFSKRVLSRDFAFKHKFGTSMPKSSFKIWGIFRKK